MANNLGVTTGTDATIKTTDNAGVHTPHHIIGDGTNAITLVNNLLASSDYAVPVMIHPDSVNANGQAASSSSAPVTIANDQVLVDDAAFTAATSKVFPVGFLADESSTDSVDENDIGAARMTLDRKIIINPQPHTAGGLSINRNLDVDESEDDIKTSAGCLYKLRISNFSTSARYVKLYNATAANTTVGSTTPLDTIPVPPASAAGNPTVITENFGGLGLTFDTALCIAATTALADADTGAPSANDVVVSAYYK